MTHSNQGNHHSRTTQAQSAAKRTMLTGKLDHKGVIHPEDCSDRTSRIPVIVSGGQSGADRAALDWAIEHGLPHHGWCPKQRRAEDGPIGERYHLRETPTANYIQRTSWNVRDSDGTVVFSTNARLRGGSQTTIQLALKQNKPVLHLARVNGLGAAKVALQAFVERNGIRVLNVAGPRASKEPEVGEFVKTVLNSVWLA